MDDAAEVGNGPFDYAGADFSAEDPPLFAFSVNAANVSAALTFGARKMTATASPAQVSGNDSPDGWFDDAMSTYADPTASPAPNDASWFTSHNPPLSLTTVPAWVDDAIDSIRCAPVDPKLCSLQAGRGLAGGRYVIDATHTCSPSIIRHHRCFF